MTSQAEALRDELEELSERECCPTCGDTTACNALEEAARAELSPDDPNAPECGYDDPLDADERERLVSLREFEESIPDWDSLIHEDDFEDYAREFAKDIGALGGWPYSCIDWEQAADELRADYTCYEIDGMTFYGQE